MIELAAKLPAICRTAVAIAGRTQQNTQAAERNAERLLLGTNVFAERGLEPEAFE
jgi:hypothetical protein